MAQVSAAGSLVLREICPRAAEPIAAMASLASRGSKSADKKPSIEFGTKGQQYEPQKELGRGNFG
eukprot:6706377-Prymnesium_polylepis.1